MAYFDQHPDLILPSFSQNRNSSGDSYITKNLFKRGKIREDFFQNAVAFEKYLVVGDDRPDNVAEEIYGDSELDWIVLISNNILNRPAIQSNNYLHKICNVVMKGVFYVVVYLMSYSLTRRVSIHKNIVFYVK